jgi:DNA invertase Pin-like site-specific DNA recombinase
MKPTTARTRRAVLYARVSDSKGGKKCSVPQQLEVGRDVIATNGWTPGPEITDDTSASRFAAKDRPGYKRLLTVLQPGDVLVIWEQSRTSRRLKEWVELRDLCVERGVLLCSGGELLDLTDTNARLSTGIKAVVNEHESDQLSDRIKRDIRKRALSGNPHAKLGFGYQKVYEPDGTWTWQEDPIAADAIRWAVDHILAGGRLRAVQREWTARGVPRAQKEGSWTITTIRQVLIRPKIAGLRTLYGEVVSKGTWPAIITEDQHQQLVARIEGNKLAEPRGKHPEHLLTNIMVCGVCGEPVCWQNRGRGGRYVCRTNGCLTRRADDSDKYVTDRVREIIAGWKADTVLFDIDEDVPPPDAGLVLIETELNALKKRLEEYRTYAKQGKLSVASLVDAEAELLPQIADLETQRKAALISPLLDVLARDALLIWGDMELVDKRALLRLSVKITMQRLGAGKRTPGKVAIDVVSIAPDRQALTTSILDSVAKR